MSRKPGSIVRGFLAPRRISAVGAGRLQVAAMYCRSGQRSRSERAGKQGVSGRRLGWQEWQGSNLRPPVLETGALPIELHSCGTEAALLIRAVSSIGHAPFARAKQSKCPVQAATSKPDFTQADKSPKGR